MPGEVTHQRYSKKFNITIIIECLRLLGLRLNQSQNAIAVAMVTPEEIVGKLVVAGCYAAKIFQAAEGVFDQVAAAVAILVVADGAFAVSPSGIDGNGSDVT